MFVEGLVPLNTLTDDRYTFHENTREIIGQRTRKTYRLGQKIRVLVDRIDPVEKKIQFAVVEEAPARAAGKRRKRSAERSGPARGSGVHGSCAPSWHEHAVRRAR